MFTLRVDDRLLHGQVAVAWTSKLQANFLIVANDEASTNNIKKMTMKLAKPASADLRILDLETTVKILNNPKLKSKRAFIVVESIEDAEYLIERSNIISDVNIGGVRQSEKIDKIKIDRQIFLNDDELKHLDNISEKGVNVYGQVAPLDKYWKLEEMKTLYAKGGVK